MNVCGSYRALLANSIAAMCGAIEIYNKPRAEYREETAFILLVNAWELLLKAILSKKRMRIFYPKKRGQPYRTLSAGDALKKAEASFPSGVPYLPVAENLKLMIEYRDKSVHFYNAPGLGTVLYTLAQTAVVNYRDLLKAVFCRDLADEVSLSLLPLGFNIPIDPVEFLKAAPNDRAASRELKEFIRSIVHAVDSVEAGDADTSRLLTVFKVSLQSVKKIGSSDLVVGVQAGAGTGAAPLLVQKNSDPNRTHPFFESAIVSSKTNPKKPGMGIKWGETILGQYVFRAIAYKYKAKDEPKWCWRDASGAVTRYSPDFVQFLKGLSQDAVQEAIEEYRKR